MIDMTDSQIYVVDGGQLVPTNQFAPGWTADYSELVERLGTNLSEEYDGWTTYGQSNQYGGGRLMHESESFSEGLIKDMLEIGGKWTTVAVFGSADDECEYCEDCELEPYGWIILHSQD